MSSRTPLLVDFGLLLLAAATVVLVEALVAPGHPLDPPARTGRALLFTAVLLVGLGGLVGWWKKRWVLPVATSLWALYVLTETAHVHGHSPWLWALPASLVAALSARWPRPNVLAIPILAALPSTTRPPVEPPATGPGTTRLLVITVDTIRADAAFLKMARLDHLPGFTTTTALAAAPWTPPSMMSLWLGADVTEHGGGIELEGRLTEPSTGWATSFPAAWASTGAVLESVTSNPYLRPSTGFGQHFAARWHADDAREPHLVLHTLDATIQRILGVDTHRGRTRDARVEQQAIARLTASDAPDVLWVHLLDPHEYNRQHRDPSPKSLHDFYSTAVRETAARVRRIVEHAPTAAVVVVGDHGESLGEQGRWGHGRAPVREVLEVPLAVRGAPLEAQPSLPDVGRWLAALAHNPEAPFVVGPTPIIAGVRGAPDQRYSWNRGLHLAVPTHGSVDAGPLAPEPSPAVRAALRDLGYVDGPSHR